MSALQRICQKILEKDYYLSAHAEEELWADELERPDVEHAILKGRIEKKLNGIFGEQGTVSKAQRVTEDLFMQSVALTK